ncbi:MAG: TonB-dependent receptor [Alcaligenaceae bacterium]|nr:TonB-dependent receptor [Alcaligenaceae bacterium]
MKKSISRNARTKKHFPLCLLTCLLSHSLYAQDTASQNPDREAQPVALLDEVVAIGTKTENTIRENPYSVTVIDQNTLQKQTSDNVAELLKDVPGIQLVDSSIAGHKRVKIRGEDPTRVAILIDGQEVTDHSSYGSPFLVETHNIERIELVRGPASVMHGSKAIGGVVNIITKKGAQRPFEADLGGTYFSATDGWQGAGSLAGTVNQFDYRLSFSRSIHHNRHVPRSEYSGGQDRLDNTAYQSDSASLHLGYRFGQENNHYLGIKAEKNRLEAKSWVNLASLSNTYKDFLIDLPKRDRSKVSVFYEADNLGKYLEKIHFDIYKQKVDREFINQVHLSPNSMVNVKVRSESTDELINYGGNLQLDFRLHPDHKTIIGLHHLADELEAHKLSSTTTAIQRPGMPFPVTSTTVSTPYIKAAINTTSVFAQDEWRLSDDLKLTAGLRYFYVKNDLKKSDPGLMNDDETYRKFIKSFGLVYTGFTNTSLRASYSEGFTIPNLAKLYTTTTAGGQTVHNNPNLKPETSKNYELGARYSNNNLVLDSAIFYSTAKNYITSLSCGVSTACASTALATDNIYVNADSAKTYGLEFLAEYTLPDTFITPYMSGTWMTREETHSGIKTKDTDTPKLYGRIGVRNEFLLFNKPVWSDLYLRAASKNKSSSGTLPGWGTLNLSAGINFGKDDSSSVSISLLNITNKKYMASYSELPASGTNIEIATRFRFW